MITGNPTVAPKIDMLLTPGLKDTGFLKIKLFSMLFPFPDPI